MISFDRWDRNRVIMVGAVLVAELLLCGYFFFYINGLKTAQAARLTQAKQQLDTLRNDAGQLTQLRKDYAEAKRVIAHLEPGIAPDRKATFLPTFLAQLHTMAKESGIKLNSLNPQKPQVKPNQPPPAQTSPSPAGGQPAPAPAAPEVPAEETLPVALQMEGDFDSLMTFIERLKSFPKIVQIDSLQTRPKGGSGTSQSKSPNLDITMNVSVTVLPLMPGVEL